MCVPRQRCVNIRVEDLKGQTNLKKIWHLQLTIRYYSLILLLKFILIHNMLKKTSNSVYREVPYLSAQILNEKSALSAATANQQRIGCLVYPESTQISYRSL